MALKAQQALQLSDGEQLADGMCTASLSLASHAHVSVWEGTGKPSMGSREKTRSM